MIRLLDERCEEIKQEVVKLFTKYNISCVPINGFEIASKMGVKVIPYSILNVSQYENCMKFSDDGFSVLNGDKWYVYYNDNKNYGRINNTLLHEIGHIVLDHTEDSDLAEKEVKFFAKYALVPPVLVHKFQITGPDEIQKIFEVSHEAAVYAWNYYMKWYMFSGKFYKPYEIELLSLFNDKSIGGDIM